MHNTHSATVQLIVHTSHRYSDVSFSGAALVMTEQPGRVHLTDVSAQRHCVRRHTNGTSPYGQCCPFRNVLSMTHRNVLHFEHGSLRGTGAGAVQLLHTYLCPIWG
jgi:hypothetical protein